MYHKLINIYFGINLHVKNANAIKALKQMLTKKKSYCAVLFLYFIICYILW